MNDIIVMEGLISKLKDIRAVKKEARSQKKAQNVLMRKISRVVYNDPQINGVIEGDKYEDLNYITNFLNLYIELCYPNKIKYNKALFLKEFRKIFGPDDETEISVNDVDPDNKKFKEYSKTYNNDFFKIKLGGQIVYYWIGDQDIAYLFTNDRGEFVYLDITTMINNITRYYQDNVDEFYKKYGDR